MNLPDVLYHGTAARFLPAILQDGIKPRGRFNKGNWQHTVTSNAKAVYLTDAYGLHFASCAAGEDDKAVILEIDTRALRGDCLIADEDTLEQANRGRDNLPEDWNLKRRTLYYRARAHNHSGLLTLKYMGTCCYKGTIIPEAIKRAVILDAEVEARLVVCGFDPQISIIHYSMLGERYREGMRWMFGDAGETFKLIPVSPEFLKASGIEEHPLIREGIEVITYQKGETK